jgi:hypothetical protein
MRARMFIPAPLCCPCPDGLLTCFIQQWLL